MIVVVVVVVVGERVEQQWRERGFCHRRIAVAREGGKKRISPKQSQGVDAVWGYHHETFLCNMNGLGRGGWRSQNLRNLILEFLI